MNRADKILIVIFTLVVLLMIASFGNLYLVTRVDKKKTLDASKPFMLTAAHCVDSLGSGTRVKINDDDTLGVPATLLSEYSRADYAVYTGEFDQLLGESPVLLVRLYNKKGHFICSASIVRLASVEMNPVLIEETMRYPVEHIVLCGYPYGGKALCSTVTVTRKEYWSYAGRGMMYPGMSGGPVIDFITKKLIAVNSGISENGEVIISPLTALVEGLELKVEGI